MRRRASVELEPELRFGFPDTEPYTCGRCGWPFDWFSRWYEFRTAAGAVAVRLHRLCPPKEPRAGYPGYATEVSGGIRMAVRACTNWRF